MIFSISLYLIGLIVPSAFGQAQHSPTLRIWEEMCLAEHNILRVAHDLKPVAWDIFMHSVADVKALNLLLEDQKIDFRAPSLNAEILDSEYISFNYEITTRKTLGNNTEDEAKAFLTFVTSDIIRSWYNNYFLIPTTQNKEKRDRILDRYAAKLGCTVHALPVNSNSDYVRIFLTVAYQQDKELMAKFKTGRIEGRGVDSSKDAPRSSGRTCTSNCTNFGSCYSHRASEGFVRSRTGTGSGRSMVGVVRENCRCEPDPELSDDSHFFSVPHCEGPCFVSCPLATQTDMKSCQGSNKCTCKYGSGGAFCE